MGCSLNVAYYRESILEKQRGSRGQLSDLAKQCHKIVSSWWSHISGKLVGVVGVGE